MQKPLFSSATPVTPVDGPAVTVAQTPADELLVRMAMRLNPNYPRVPAYVQQAMLADMRAVYGEVVGTPNPVELGTYVAREPLVAYGHADLQDLKARLLTPREIVREEGGYLYHPELPVLDESVRIDEFLAAFGIDTEFVCMETDCPNDPRVDEYFEGDEPDCSWWEPTPPEGGGWQLAEIYDTENGVYAMFVRGKLPKIKVSRRIRLAPMGDPDHPFEIWKTNIGDLRVTPVEPGPNVKQLDMGFPSVTPFEAQGTRQGEQGPCLCQEDLGHPEGTCIWVDGKRRCECDSGSSAKA